MAVADENEGTRFDAGLGSGWEAWLQAVAQGGAGEGAAAPWREGIAQWMRLVAADASPQVQAVGDHFQRQAGDWLGTMQQVAARFAGQDTSAAEVAGAWREAVEGQGDVMLRWMLDAARGGNAMADQPWVRDFAHALQSGFGGPAWLDAPAFGPAREHQARWQALLRTQREHQERMEAYAQTIRGVLEDAFGRFESKLAAHEAPGSQLTSARAMFDLWIDAAEEAYAAIAMSEEFQRIYADLANSQMRLRAAARHELERACELMGIPTRTEMDAAHRRIAELERWMRRTAAGMAEAAPAPAGRAGDAAKKKKPASGAKARTVPGKAATKKAAKKVAARAAPRRGGKA